MGAAGPAPQALHHDQQALALFRAAGHRRGQALALNAIGWEHALLGHHTQAVDCYQHALTLVRDLGDRYGAADILTDLDADAVRAKLRELDQVPPASSS